MGPPRTDAEILEAHPAPAVVAEVSRRYAKAAAARRRRRLQAVTPVAVAAVAGLMLLAGPLTPPETERMKGPAASLYVHRANADGVELLHPGATARAGDVLQLSYRSTGPVYGVIVSVDGRGAVTLHLPAEPGDASLFDHARPVPLGHAYKLDDAPAFEEFHLVTSKQPFSSDAVTDALRAGRPLPATLDDARFRLIKEVP